MIKYHLLKPCNKLLSTVLFLTLLAGSYTAKGCDCYYASICYFVENENYIIVLGKVAGIESEKPQFGDDIMGIDVVQTIQGPHFDRIGLITGSSAACFISTRYVSERDTALFIIYNYNPRDTNDSTFYSSICDYPILDYSNDSLYYEFTQNDPQVTPVQSYDSFINKINNIEDLIPSLTIEKSHQSCAGDFIEIPYEKQNFNQINYYVSSKHGTNLGSGVSYESPIRIEFIEPGNWTIGMLMSSDECTVEESIQVDVVPKEEPPTLQSVSFNPASKHVKLAWEREREIFTSYNIYRRLANEEFALLANIDAQQSNTYLDTNSIPEENIYEYTISGVCDSCCGNESTHSEPHSTLNLSIIDIRNNYLTLDWNDYTGFDFSSYLIYRSKDGELFEVIAEVPKGQSAYQDLDIGSSRLAYYVKVVSNEQIYSSNPVLGSRAEAVSNTADLSLILGTSIPTEDLKLYPNPTNGIININSSANFELTSLSGLTVKRGSIQKNQIWIDDVEDGVYLLRIKNETESITKKIVKKSE